MKHSFLISAALAAAVSALTLGSAQAGELKIGVTPVPHAEIIEFIKPALKKEGVDIKIVEFNDYVQPNLAVDSKELDLNFFQHAPYLDSFISEHGSKLINLFGVHIEPIGAYSSRVKDVKDLKEGAKVAIPNDPTNGGRALLLLQTQGLLSLKDPKSITSTVQDIKENKLGLKFIELEAPQLPRSLDEVDLAIINTNYAIDAGLNPIKDALFIEDGNSPYVNVVVGNPDSAKNPDTEVLKKVLLSDEVKKFILDKYQGAVVPAF